MIVFEHLQPAAGFAPEESFQAGEVERQRRIIRRLVGIVPVFGDNGVRMRRGRFLRLIFRVHRSPLPQQQNPGG